MHDGYEKIVNVGKIINKNPERGGSGPIVVGILSGARDVVVTKSRNASSFRFGGAVPRVDLN